MSEPRIINIEFFPEKHEYFVNGRKADISVTSLIGKHIDKTEWSTIPEDILKRAADRGTAVHLDLELMIKDNRPPETEEAKNFKEWLASQKLENPRTEFKLAIEHRGLLLTGTADLIATLNSLSTVADYKTTSVVHTESVRWQMSLLDYMARKCSGAIINGELFEYEPAQQLFCFHFNKAAKFTPVPAAAISDIEIERLLDAEAAGQEYYPTTFITPRVQSDVLSIQSQIAIHKREIKALEARDAALKAALCTAFEANPDIKSVECPEFKITYVSPVAPAPVFDSKAFEEANPTEAAKYQKMNGGRKGYVLITLKDEVGEGVQATSSLPPLPPGPTKREKAKKGYFGEV